MMQSRCTHFLKRSAQRIVCSTHLASSTHTHRSLILSRQLQAPQQLTQRCAIHAPLAAIATQQFHPQRCFSTASSSPAPNSPSSRWPPSIDTIYQLASGLGSSKTQPAVGVAAIRISGPLALPIAMTLTRRRLIPKARVATHASLYRPKNEMDEKEKKRFERYQQLTGSEDTAAASDTSSLIDSGILLLYFPSPHSFTGESVVELHVHGTQLIVAGVFEALETINRQLVESMVTKGNATSASSSTSYPSIHHLSSILSTPPLIRMADPGEFTRRAFLNGKLDLTQVEALSDLLLASTEKQKEQALIQIRGELSKYYTQWREDLLNSLAYIEAILDFSEDEQDVGENEIMKNVLPKVKDVMESLRLHLKDHRRGEIIRDGIGIVIVGAPNAGKSSLLNALSQRNIAIVSPVPGTTRDIVENRINIAGYPCIIADTAGLREIQERTRVNEKMLDGESTQLQQQPSASDLLLSGHDLIEAEGMQRTHERTKEADMKLVLLDASKLLAGEEKIDQQILQLIDERSIVVWTKMDLLNVPNDDATTTTADSLPSSSPSASSTGRAKLRSAQQFYSDARDTFTPSQKRAFQDLAMRSENYRNVESRTRKMVWMSCPSISSSTADKQQRPNQNRGVQDLLATIEQAIQQTVGLDAPSPSSSLSSSSSSSIPLITRQRHRLHVESCVVFLELFSDYVHRGDLVLAAEQLRLATREIGKITGRVDVEELLDVIFADFCIGK